MIRAWALTKLAPQLAELGHLEEALAVAREIRGADDRAKALSALAPYLSETERAAALQEALAAARETGNAHARVGVLAGLAPHLPEPEQGQALREALEAAWELPELTRGGVSLRAGMLIGLATQLPEPLKGEALREALVAARRLSESDRAEALAKLAPHLAKLPRQHLYPLWQETLPILAIYTRKDLLADLRALEPVIAALGGPEAVAETFRAIQDVGRWWP